MKHIWIAALSLLTTSCGIYNKYERPELGTVQTDSLYRAEAAPDTTSSIASLGWEELFTDPYLQSLIQRGLKANTDLQTAALRVKEAQAALMSSKLAYLPSLQLDPQGSLSSYDGSKTQKTYSLGGLCLVGNRPLRKADQCQAQCPCGPARKRSLPTGHADPSHSHRSRQLLCPADA